MIRAFELLRNDSGYGAGRSMRNLLFAIAASLALTPAAFAEVRILAFGDSLTQGFGLPQEEGLVPQLEAWLHANGAPDVTIINGGVSGDTTSGGLNRIAWSLQDDVDGVIVALGGNDLLRGIDTSLMQSNLDGILTEIDSRNLPVLLAGLPAPPNYGEEYRKQFHAMFRQLAEKHEAIYYRSLLSGMGEGRNVIQVMRLMQPDGIHPNARGVEAIVDHFGPTVLELVAEARD